MIHVESEIVKLIEFIRSRNLNGNRMAKWDKAFNSGPSKICGRQPLINLKGYGLLKRTIFL